MRVAVTGAGGRLGRALVASLADSPLSGIGGPIAWTREQFDLDAPQRFAALVGRDRPEVVVHAAAWTDVDGCARDPELAMTRNATATSALAHACATAGADLVVISTNEVFDGRRTDGRGYSPDDEPSPINPYGASKLAAERLAAEAMTASAPPAGQRGSSLAIVRTAWLFGPPGSDFPGRILAAAEKASAAGERMKLVADEIGSPTYTLDLADAIVELLAETPSGIHHVVNTGRVSRAGWAREVFRQANVRVETEDVPATTWKRDSTPPAWAVLEPTPLPSGEPLRPWQEALADHVPSLLRQRSTAGR
ncbi:MAG: SDR family oxidoreductase [Chloroflexota bacterium]